MRFGLKGVLVLVHVSMVNLSKADHLHVSLAYRRLLL